VGGDAGTEAAQNRMFGLSGRGIFRDAQSRRRRSDGIFNNFYIRVKETSTGVNAFKILVSRNGGISPEPGPNMMWNAKYSPMANMMGRWFVPNARNSVSLA